MNEDLLALLNVTLARFEEDQQRWRAKAEERHQHWVDLVTRRLPPSGQLQADQPERPAGDEQEGGVRFVQADAGPEGGKVDGVGQLGDFSHTETVDRRPRRQVDRPR